MSFEKEMIRYGALSGSTNRYGYVGTRFQQQENSRLVIHKCQSCGAPLKRHECAYCGATHHGHMGSAQTKSMFKPGQVIECDSRSLTNSVFGEMIIVNYGWNCMVEP